ncbi:cache domain-containing protein [Xanthomonas sp. PPL568]|uniref:cache domain-containing protein n=1 Tax=Xanthomonas indica TaxID=2912242 RepID=UPI001F5ADF08|nr:cache domain-containing protein [Xanthomonas indica]MCI2243074.1 cache domain-containing protein [Xanthomonas indica]
MQLRVRGWATDATVAAAARADSDAEALAYASRRVGQVPDSYTVSFDLILAGSDGRIRANGRPRQFTSVGSDASAQPWFEPAVRTRSGGTSASRACMPVGWPMASGRVLVYACAVCEGGRVDGRVLGALGIVLRWDALAQTIVRRTPLSESERGRSRVCIVDARGEMLDDSAGRMLQDRLDFDGRDALFKQPRSALLIDLEGRSPCIAHVAAPSQEPTAPAGTRRSSRCCRPRAPPRPAQKRQRVTGYRVACRRGCACGGMAHRANNRPTASPEGHRRCLNVSCLLY